MQLNELIDLLKTAEFSGVARELYNSNATRAACLEHLLKLDVAVDALRRHGYRESCDIPACNCGDQWNHGGHAAERLRELADVLYENGKTPLQVAKGLVDRLDKVQLEYEKYAGLCFACTPYLKEHETPAECIQRNRDDVTQMLGMLAKERKELEAARSRLDRAFGLLQAHYRKVDADLPELCSELEEAMQILRPNVVEKRASIPDEERQTCRHCGGFIPCAC